jgi:hypothetical protein
LCDKYYDLPDTKSQRGAGFGYSSKYDFTKGIEKTPDPTKYLIKSDFEKMTENKLGVSIGQSREVAIFK